MKLGISKFQQGGPMPQLGGDPMQELIMSAQLALESQDCQMMALVCQILIQMAGGSVEQGGAPAPAPQEGEPVYRMGGILSRRIKK